MTDEKCKKCMGRGQYRTKLGRAVICSRCGGLGHVPKIEFETLPEKFISDKGDGESDE